MHCSQTSTASLLSPSIINFFFLNLQNNLFLLVFKLKTKDRLKFIAFKVTGVHSREEILSQTTHRIHCIQPTVLLRNSPGSSSDTPSHKGQFFKLKALSLSEKKNMDRKTGNSQIGASQNKIHITSHLAKPSRQKLQTSLSTILLSLSVVWFAKGLCKERSLQVCSAKKSAVK